MYAVVGTPSPASRHDHLGLGPTLENPSFCIEGEASALGQARSYGLDNARCRPAEAMKAWIERTRAGEG